MPNPKLTLEITNNIADFIASELGSEKNQREALTNLVVSIMAQVDSMIEDRIVVHNFAWHNTTS